MIPDNKSIKSLQLILLGILVLAGIVIYQLGLLENRFFLELGEKHLEKWWIAPLLILIKATLYAFALPGSIIYLAAGFIYEPLHATLIIVAGGVSGSTAAYFLSRSMSRQNHDRIQSSKAFSVIKKHSDFAALSAARTLPGFPHSIINYGSGILKIPLTRFILTAAIGFAAKGFLYASAIHQATRMDDFRETSTLQMAGPLILLALLFVAGKIMHGKKIRNPCPFPNKGGISPTSHCQTNKNHLT